MSREYDDGWKNGFMMGRGHTILPTYVNRYLEVGMVAEKIANLLVANPKTAVLIRNGSFYISREGKAIARVGTDDLEPTEDTWDGVLKALAK